MPMQKRTNVKPSKFNLTFEFKPAAYKSPTKEGYYSAAHIKVIHDLTYGGKLDKVFWEGISLTNDATLYKTEEAAKESAKKTMAIFPEYIWKELYVGLDSIQDKILKREKGVKSAQDKHLGKETLQGVMPKISLSAFLNNPEFAHLHSVGDTPLKKNIGRKCVFKNPENDFQEGKFTIVLVQKTHAGTLVYRVVGENEDIEDNLGRIAEIDAIEILAD